MIARAPKGYLPTHDSTRTRWLTNDLELSLVNGSNLIRCPYPAWNQTILVPAVVCGVLAGELPTEGPPARHGRQYLLVIQ
jgi:hypothetical protein